LEAEFESPPQSDPRFLDFGVDEEDGRRYVTLTKEIARLESQAEVAKKAEAAAAVRWIRKAIGEHEISAEELGL
jgi:hypothetical protein